MMTLSCALVSIITTYHFHLSLFYQAIIILENPALSAIPFDSKTSSCYNFLYQYGTVVEEMKCMNF